MKLNIVTNTAPPASDIPKIGEVWRHVGGKRTAYIRIDREHPYQIVFFYSIDLSNGETVITKFNKDERKPIEIALEPMTIKFP